MAGEGLSSQERVFEIREKLISIDGPDGIGKSSLTKVLAENYSYSPKAG